MAPLGGELIAAILGRLPVKSVVRFRCVSKEWSSLFSEPYFSKLHCQKQNLKLIVKHGSLYSVDPDSLDCALRVDLGAAVKRVLGCSNGAVCLSTDPDDVIMIFTIGAGRVVPPCDVSLPDALEGRKTNNKLQGTVVRRVSRGFGFDPSSGGDYKIVMVTQYVYWEQLGPREERVLWSSVEVYSAKANSWSSVSVDEDHVLSSHVLSLKEPVVVDGTMHWVAGRTRDHDVMIVAFDLSDCKFRVMEEPQWPDGVFDVFKIGLGRWGGRLCTMCVHVYTFELQIQLQIGFWAVEGNNSWALLAWYPCFPNSDQEYYFWFPGGYSSSIHDKALIFSDNGDKVLVEQLKDTFISCDLVRTTAAASQMRLVDLLHKEGQN